VLVSAAEQYRIQQGISTTTAAGAVALWGRMDGDFDTAWARIRPQTLDLVEKGRTAAVVNALGYTAAALAETGQVDDAVGTLVPAAFLRSAPDGRDVGALLDGAVYDAKSAVARGLAPDAALAQGSRWMSMATLTLLADTRREVYGADIIQRPTLNGYTRMLNPPSCSRCIILAGRWYRWNEGFRRHPRCDCQHIPASESVAGDMRVDPYETFRSMTPEQQERVFGRSQARAIRDGADIYRVVNINQRGLATAKGAARYGTPSRMTVDDIYRVAGTRTNAIRLMQREGYILDRGQVTVARAPGVRTDAQILAAGRGRGTVTIGGQTATTRRASRFDAAQTGQRDPLNRATMTAAERRLYDANYRLQYARTTGNVPRGVGLSSADVFAAPIPATAKRLADLEQDLAREVRRLSERGTPQSVRRLARALGLI